MPKPEPAKDARNARLEKARAAARKKFEEIYEESDDRPEPYWQKQVTLRKWDMEVLAADVKVAAHLLKSAGMWEMGERLLDRSINLKMQLDLWTD